MENKILKSHSLFNLYFQLIVLMQNDTRKIIRRQLIGKHLNSRVLRSRVESFRPHCCCASGFEVFTRVHGLEITRTIRF